MRSICGSGIPVILVGCKRDLRDAADEHEHPGKQFVSKEKVRSLHSLLYVTWT